MAFDQKALDDYVDVAERLTEFYDRYPEGSLRAAEPWRIVQAEGWDRDGKHVMQTFIVYQAAAYRTADDPAPGIGTAWEVFPGRTPYTRGSEIMNAETSAWGRAMAALGIATKRGIASRQEVQGARERADGLPTNRDGSLSRSRTSDEEKAAAGVMTSAQRAEHTALVAKPAEMRAGKARGSQVDPDQWQDTGQQAERDYDSPGTITRGQQSQYHARMDALGIKDRDEKLRVAVGILWPGSNFAQASITSSSDLSKNQADVVVAVLRAAGAGDSVAQLAIEEARRRTG